MFDFFDLLVHSSIGEEFHHFYDECYLFYHDDRFDFSSLTFHDFVFLCFDHYFLEEFAIEFRKLNLHEEDSI